MKVSAEALTEPLIKGDNPWGGGGSGGYQVAQWSPPEQQRDALTAGDNIPSRTAPEPNPERAGAGMWGEIVGRSLGTASPLPGGKAAGSYLGREAGEALYDSFQFGGGMGSNNAMAGDPTERDERGGLGGYAGPGEGPGH